MNIQDYISTGVLEAYALGSVTAQERAEVERNLMQNPELRAELNRIEETLEALALQTAIVPAPSVRQNLMKEIGTSSVTKVVSLSSATRTWKLAAAASITVALMASYLAWNYRSRWIESDTALSKIIAQNQQIANDYNVVNQKLDKIQGDLSIMESTAFRKVVLKGTANDKNALAVVYWNESSREVFLSVQHLKEISQEKQYQLWADVNGKMVSVGVFDNVFTGLLKMPKMGNATAFAITIEPRGGKENPTLETLQVIGNI